MQKKILWVAAALVLIATPAVIGLVALRGDDGARSKAALVKAGGAVPRYELIIAGLTPSGQAIDVTSYSFGVSKAGVTPGSTATTSKAQFSNLEITKKMDQTSALLVGAVAAQTKPYATASLRLYRGQESVQNYVSYELANVWIASVQHGGQADDVPTEQVSIAYRSLELSTAGVDEGGMLESPSIFKFDLATDTKY